MILTKAYDQAASDMRRPGTEQADGKLDVRELIPMIAISSRVWAALPKILFMLLQRRAFPLRFYSIPLKTALMLFQAAVSRFPLGGDGAPLYVDARDHAAKKAAPHRDDSAMTNGVLPCGSK